MIFEWDAPSDWSDLRGGDRDRGDGVDGNGGGQSQSRWQDDTNPNAGNYACREPGTSLFTCHFIFRFLILYTFLFSFFY